MSIPTLGQRLCSLRKQRNLSQTIVSKEIQISRQAYSAYERDVRLPNYQTLCKLTEIFDVFLDFLLGEYINNAHATLLEESATNLQEDNPFVTTSKYRYENLGDEEKKLIALYSQANDIARKKTMAYLELQVKKGKANQAIPSSKDEQQLQTLQNILQSKKDNQ